MLTHPQDPQRVLIELSDLDDGCPAEEIRRYLGPLQEITTWAREYLCNPHPDLGREGPVCPYVQASMRRRHFYLAVHRGALDQPTVEQLIMGYRDWFLDLEPRTSEPNAGLKTILVLFPDVSVESLPEIIDTTQEKLKPGYVEKGLMVGEFHPGPPRKAGLWNPDFRALESPVPMLVIRHMVPTDYAFLKDSEEFFRSYLVVHGKQVPAHLREEVAKTALSYGIHVPNLQEMAAVHPRVAAALQEHEIPFVLHRHDQLDGPINGPHDVARALGYPVERITKALFLHNRKLSKYVIVVGSVNHRLSLQRVSDHMGYKRLELAGQAELSAWLGFSAGGVSPLGAENIPVVLDEDLLQYPTVLTAAGEVRVELEISPHDLRRAADATVLPLRQSQETTAVNEAADEE